MENATQLQNNQNEYVAHEYFDTKFNEMDRKFDEKFDDLAGMIKTGFDEMGFRIDRVEGRMDGLEQRMDNLEQEARGIRNELQNVTQRLDVLEKKVDRLYKMENEDVTVMQNEIKDLRIKYAALEQKVLQLERQNAAAN